MFIEVKENMLIRNTNIRNLSRELANMKENPMEILDLKIQR